MEERLKEILNQERLTPARFAELVGVQRSSVSHIISGRNKPSLDFLQKILSKLGHISPDWLISGTGPYKRSDALIKQADTRQSAKKMANQEGRIEFPSAKPSAKEEDPVVYGATNGPETASTPVLPTHASNPRKNPNPEYDKTPSDSGNHTGLKKNSDEKKIIKTLLFYDDHTFEVFYPQTTDR